MANIHSFFYSSDTYKQTLHRRIVPNQKQFEQQQERWHDLRDYLVTDLNEKTGLPVSSWLQGSYKFGTQVRPKNKKEHFDIDLGIYFTWNDSRNAGTFTPLELKQLVQESLKVYASETADATIVLEPPKERCNRISFTEGFHIDVPVYHLNETDDLRSLAVQSDGWEDSDPKAIYLWFRDCFSEEDSNQVRRLIRYLKMWATLNLENPPSSILLTVLAAEAYLGLSNDDVGGDDVALHNLARSIKTRLESSDVVGNPVDYSENLNRLSEEEYFLFLEELDGLISISDRALSTDSEASAASIWTEAFKHFFPAPSEETIKTNESTALTKVLFVPQVSVVATSTTNSHVGPWRGTDRVGPIPRGCSIKFKLTNFDHLPQGAHVQWIVRNEGDEAECINDLGHQAGTNSREADENSAYNGSHYMDVIVTIPFQGVVGFARIEVEIKGPPVPARNPKKPGYTKIQRRR